MLKRFEEIGIDSFHKLKDYEAETIAEMVATLLNTSCWKNSPQAKSAIEAAICKARELA